MSVIVRVPATVANLGPGFDCLGFAIDWHNAITVERAERTTIEVTGPGENRIPRDGKNLVLRSIRTWEIATGQDPGEYAIRIDNESPYGRGFGSSAAAIVGGLVAARALTGGDASVLQLAGGIEGHLDNVSAAYLGGITVSGYSADDAVRLDPPSSIVPLICVAPGRLSTSAARASLPAEVPFKDATFNAARAALLASALATGDTRRLLAATEDRLHQPYRFEIAPATGALVTALRDRGYAAFLSGAGPSVSALVPVPDAGAATAHARDAAPEGWDVRVVSFDAAGAIEATA